MPDTVPAPDHSSKLSAPIQLELVRRAFDRPQEVADSQFLRREIARRMLERLELIKIAPQCVIDAGCGEGADLPVLQGRFPEARVIGVDASHAMLSLAGAQYRGAQSSLRALLPKFLSGAGRSVPPSLISGDFAALSLAQASADLVWSNLAFHWHPQPDKVFAEWRRVLRTDGLLMFSCFGPDTFKGVRAAFSELDGAPHTLPFVDMHDFGDMLVNAGFATPVMDMETITVTYKLLDKLWSDLRAWGGNPLATRRRGLIGRHAWARVCDAIEANRDPAGNLSLTFEIIYGHAFRPVSRTTAAGETIIRLDLNKK